MSLGNDFYTNVYMCALHVYIDWGFPNSVYI